MPERPGRYPHRPPVPPQRHDCPQRRRRGYCPQLRGSLLRWRNASGFGDAVSGRVVDACGVDGADGRGRSVHLAYPCLLEPSSRIRLFESAFSNCRTVTAR
ncbi:hypothetical protein GTY49_41750 [Streptomyces sp. SID5477]|nr:hypothetical protein [Streptomyces sp. SID5477]